MSQPIRLQDGHLGFPIGPKNMNLVKDIDILLPINFRWIPLSISREEVDNMEHSRWQMDDRECVITIVHLSLRKDLLHKLVSWFGGHFSNQIVINVLSSLCTYRLSGQDLQFRFIGFQQLLHHLEEAFHKQVEGVRVTRHKELVQGIHSNENKPAMMESYCYSAPQTGWGSESDTSLGAGPGHP